MPSSFYQYGMGCCFALDDTIPSWNPRGTTYILVVFHAVQVVVPRREETPRNAANLSQLILYNVASFAHGGHQIKSEPGS
jgi:hypothetical protein